MTAKTREQTLAHLTAAAEAYSRAIGQAADHDCPGRGCSCVEVVAMAEGRLEQAAEEHAKALAGKRGAA